MRTTTGPRPLSRSSCNCDQRTGQVRADLPLLRLRGPAGQGQAVSLPGENVPDLLGMQRAGRMSEEWHCVMCGKRIEMMIFVGSGVCSDQCRKERCHEQRGDDQERPVVE